MTDSSLHDFAERVKKAGGTLTPATEQQIQDVENELGRPLPEDLRSLFRLTNGVNDVSVNGRYRVFSLDGLLHYWKLSMEIATSDSGCEGIGGAQDAYFLPDWFPILGSGDSSFLAYDNDPGSEGTKGQLVLVDPQDEYREVRSPSLWSWLAAAAIEAEE